MPEFGKVFDILLVKNGAFLCVSLYTTKGTDAHYHSYLIAPSHGIKLIHVSECNDYLGSLHPLRSYWLKATPGNEYIVTKCFVNFFSKHIIVYQQNNIWIIIGQDGNLYIQEYSRICQWMQWLSWKPTSPEIYSLKATQGNEYIVTKCFL